VKIRRFSGHPQVRGWAIIPFQGEYQVLAVTGNWTMLTYNYTIEENSHSVTGNRTRISTRAGLLLPLYSSAVCLSSLVYSFLSILLKLWYLVIARVPDLCSPCQILPLLRPLLFHQIWPPPRLSPPARIDDARSPIPPFSYRYLAH
jgi:hypothetical protein